MRWRDFVLPLSPSGFHLPSWLTAAVRLSTLPRCRLQGLPPSVEALTESRLCSVQDEAVPLRLFTHQACLNLVHPCSSTFVQLWASTLSQFDLLKRLHITEQYKALARGGKDVPRTPLYFLFTGGDNF